MDSIPSLNYSNQNDIVNGKIYGWQSRSSKDQGNAKLLRLKIFRGLHLAKKDIFGASDPYVRVHLLKKNRKKFIDSVYTATKKRTLNPCWNEEFIFRVLPNKHELLIEVFDENRLTRDDFLGKVELSLSDILTETDGETISPKPYVLQQRSHKSKVRGQLELYIAYINSSEDSESTCIGNLDSLSTQLTDDNDLDWEIINRNNSLEELPSGWEELQDTNGRTYFVNHNTRTTQWERPSDFAPNQTSTNQQNIRTDFPPGTNLPNVPGSSQGHQYDNDLAHAFNHRFHIDSSLNCSTTSSSSSSTSFDDSNERNNRSTNESQISDLNQTDQQISNSANPNDEQQSESNDNDNQTISSQTHHNNHYHHNHHSQQTTLSLDQHQVRNQVSRSNSISSSQSDSTVQEIPNNSLGPMPHGWTQQVAETGRVFFIDHTRKITTWVDPRTGKPSPSPQSLHNRSVRDQNGKKTMVDDLGPLPPGWEERFHRDGRIFFINHNTRTTQWEDPRIDNSVISGTPMLYSKSYKKKYEELMNSLPRSTNVPNKFEIKVKRNNILEDSFRIISNVSRVDYLKTKLWIEFDNEEVLDYGGPCREWFYLLSKEMFNPYYGLFEYSSADKYTLQIKPYSGLCNEMHLAYFKFIGRVAGMAIYHGKLLDAFFIRPFYKMMLSKEITLKDMESVDTEYYNSLKFILENNPSELYLNFSIDEKFLDVVEEKELKPNGAQIPVTNENKQEYINLVIDWRFVSRVKPQMDSFLEGFLEIIPKNLIQKFDENELELLMCGIGNVDVKDWKQNTIYKSGYHPNHIVIQWFWRVVLSFNNEMRSRLLQFVTGTSRVPMNGFKELYGSNGPQLFTIEKWGSTQNLPRSHTCFNRLDLPSYESYSDLRDKLIKAIEGSESYGGVD